MQGRPGVAQPRAPIASVYDSEKLAEQSGIPGRGFVQMSEPVTVLVDDGFQLCHFFQTGSPAGDAKTALPSTRQRHSWIGRGSNQVVDHDATCINLPGQLCARALRQIRQRLKQTDIEHSAQGLLHRCYRHQGH